MNIEFVESYRYFLPVLLVLLACFSIMAVRSDTFAIIAVIFLVFFGNSLEDYRLTPAAINSLAEFLILLLFLKSIIRKLGKGRYEIRFPFIIAAFIVVSLASWAMNRTNALAGILYLRLLFRYFLFFLALVNLDIEEDRLRMINKFLFFVIILQVPVAFLKSLKYGIGEMSIGTYEGYHGGSQSTMLPLIAISFLMGFYFFCKRSALFIALAIGFIGFAIVGGKRAFLFYLPVVVLYLAFAVSNYRVNATLVKTAVFGGILVAATAFLAPRYIPTLNPDQVRLWRDDKSETGVSAVLKYAIEYNLAEDGDISTGRISTMVRAFEIVWERGIPTLLLGLGPGYTFESRINKDWERDIPIGYGITDLAFILLQLGVFGTLLYFLIPLKLLLITRRLFLIIHDSYWKAFAFGTHGYCLVMLLSGSTYCLAFLGDTIPCVFFYCTSVLLSLRGKLCEKDSH